MAKSEFKPGLTLKPYPLYDPALSWGKKAFQAKHWGEGIHEVIPGECVMGLVQGQDQSWCC